MPDVTTEPVIEPVVTPVIEPATKEASLEDPSQGGPQGEPHPLEPGGDRFKQVWARAKTAEGERDSLKAELQREREERIRYEERLRVQDTQPVKQEPRYTWAQLEEHITNGTLTRAQASEYRENLLKQDAVAEINKTLDQRLQQVERVRRVTTDLDRYKTLVPNISQAGTPERDKVTQEFRYMVEVLGMPNTTATELAAARAAFGDLSALERTKLAETTRRDNLEATVETNTPGKTPAKGKDPIDALTPREKDHYTNMIKRGRYKGGWDEVRKELTWTRGQK